MTNPEPLRKRKLLWVSDDVHAMVEAKQALLTGKLGYRVTQSEAVRLGMEAIEREQEQPK